MLDRPSNILVAGDVILDQYVHGTAERISPEAAVPVFVESGHVEHRLGGAAAVAMLAAALGARVQLAGIIGWADGGRAARRISDLLERAEIDDDLIRCVPRREPTIKRRFVTPAGQVLRVDRETREPFTGARADAWREAAAAAAGQADIVLLADYGKGALSKETCRALFAANRRSIVDPGRGVHWHRYEGCWGIKPNLAELRDAQPIGASWTLTTRGGQGMLLQQRAPLSAVEIPARPSLVRDVCGAGDQVLATLGVCLAGSMDLVEACRLANIAAGLQCERLGIAPVSRHELARAATRGKLRSLPEAAAWAEECRRRGQRVVFTNGCFDLFHAGHALSLAEAKAQGDLLIVGINSDASARAIKGPRRPYRPAAQRAAIVEALECVDCVVVFETPSVEPLVEWIRPHVLVKGGDYRGHEDEIPGRQFVLRSRGGRLHITAELPDVSTTAIADAIAGPIPAINVADSCLREAA